MSGSTLVPRQPARDLANYGGLDQGVTNWHLMRDQAAILVASGFLPQSIRTPEQAVAIMLKGHELRIPPMQSMNSIAVINGKPVCSAELMRTLILRDHGDDAIVFTEATAEKVTISYKRRAWRNRQQLTYTLFDARRAGLADTANWKKYPREMMVARATSTVGRMAFPDSLAGMYTPDELGASSDPETGDITGAPVSLAGARPRPVAVAMPDPLGSAIATRQEGEDPEDDWPGAEEEPGDGNGNDTWIPADVEAQTEELRAGVYGTPDSATDKQRLALASIADNLGRVFHKDDPLTKEEASHLIKTWGDELNKTRRRAGGA